MTKKIIAKAKEPPKEEYEYALKIKRVCNGYILEGWGDGESKLQWLVQEKEDYGMDNLEELKATQNLLYEVMEYFGMYGTKHDKYRLKVIILDQVTDEVVE